MDEGLTAPPLRPPLANTAAPRDQEPDAADVEKIKKWQEERIARRLRGEYESAVLHLAEVVNENLSTPLRIASIRVEGAVKTRKSFLGSLVHPFLPKSTADADATLGSVLHTTRHLGSVLQQTDIFQSVEARLERSRSILAQPEDVDVVFKARERGRLYLNTSTEIGNNEGGASATCRVRNAFGGAETLEANVSFGTKTRVAFQASLSAPLTASLGTRGELAVFGLERDNSSFASSAEGVRGVRASVRTGTPAKGQHELSYEAVLRHISNLAPSASISMREAAGQTTKSAVSHVYTRDTRDDALLGRTGAYVRLAHELAGLGGDASFAKAEGHAQLARPLLPGVTVSVAARGGLLWAFGGRSLFSDRFQLGGPVSVRMFRANGMGPRDGPDSLGGDMYWALGLSLISDFPRKPHWPVKVHAFVDAGRLDALDKSKPLADTLAASFRQPSLSVGLGLVYRLAPVRVELNLGMPLVAAKSDALARIVQVGVGLEFL